MVKPTDEQTRRAFSAATADFRSKDWTTRLEDAVLKVDAGEDEALRDLQTEIAVVRTIKEYGQTNTAFNKVVALREKAPSENIILPTKEQTQKAYHRLISKKHQKNKTVIARPRPCNL